MHARLALLLRPVAPAPRLTRWDWAVDAMLAFTLTVGTLESALGRTGPSIRSALETPAGHGGAQWWQVLLALATAAPLVVRRRFPLAAYCVVMTATLVYHRS